MFVPEFAFRNVRKTLNPSGTTWLASWTATPGFVTLDCPVAKSLRFGADPVEPDRTVTGWMVPFTGSPIVLSHLQSVPRSILDDLGGGNRPADQSGEGVHRGGSPGRGHFDKCLGAADERLGQERRSVRDSALLQERVVRPVRPLVHLDRPAHDPPLAGVVERMAEGLEDRVMHIGNRVAEYGHRHAVRERDPGLGDPVFRLRRR